MSTDSHIQGNLPGNLYVISAPSGAGKSSLVKALLNADQNLSLSVSHTTRSLRGQEENGKAYWFVDGNRFKEMIHQGLFLEWAIVHGNYYGTSHEAISQKLETGKDVILEIDWQGALQIKTIHPQSVLIFILPPSWDELHSRLVQRNEDSAEVIQSRMNNANIEVKKAPLFDYLVINDSFEKAFDELQCIIKAQRLRFTSQQKNRPEVFSSLGF